jgi:hypothetical protein
MTIGAKRCDIQYICHVCKGTAGTAAKSRRDHQHMRISISLEAAVYKFIGPILGLAGDLGKRGAGTGNSKRDGSGQRGRSHGTLPGEFRRWPACRTSGYLFETGRQASRNPSRQPWGVDGHPGCRCMVAIMHRERHLTMAAISTWRSAVEELGDRARLFARQQEAFP